MGNFGCGNYDCLDCYPLIYRCEHGTDFPEPVPNGQPVPDCEELGCDPEAADAAHWLYDPEAAEYVDADSLAVGDVIAYRDKPRAEVLRPHEPFEDRFGRTMHRYWCRALDGSDREGWVEFGPGGRLPRELPGALATS